MKKIFIILNALALLMAPIPFSAFAAQEENVTHAVDGINTYREADTLIIYNESGTTGSNPYGYEVVVNKENRVTSVGGNNNAIPTGGFVVSGHGKSATFLAENVKVGDKIVFVQESMIISIGEKEASPFYNSTMAFNGINIYRDADFTVIYLPSNGATTGTNSYGYEVTVENGIVTKCGGNNSVIPKNGFVISAHGSAATALQGHASIGMQISYDSKTQVITFEYGKKSLLIADETKLQEAENAFKEAVENCYVINTSEVKQKVEDARLFFEEIKAQLENSESPDEYLSKRQDLFSQIEEIKSATSECRPVEYRAVWIEPTETNQKQVKKTVQELHDLGINTICLETLVQATVIYVPAEDSLFRQMPTLRGFDLLQAYIDECHALDMELHVWMPVFCVGSTSSKYVAFSLFNKKPEWRITASDGTNYGDSYALFLDPANEEACNYLLESYKYILEKYDIDGFQLDYIRYPHTGNCDWGYSGRAVEEFKEKYGVTPKFEPSASYWSDWCKFRADYVTDFVKKMRVLVDTYAPNVKLSADLYGHVNVAPTAVYQNGKEWIESNLLDIAFPMTYDETGAFADKASAYISLKSDALIVCGIGSYMTRQNASMSRDQVKKLRVLGAEGYSFFENTSYMSRNIGDTLLKGAFASPAVSPLAKDGSAIKAYADFTKQRINSIILEAALIDSDTANKLCEMLSALTPETATVDRVDDIEAVISEMENGNAKKALSKDIAYLRTIVSAYCSIVPEEDESSAPLPDESDISENAGASSESSAQEKTSSSAAVYGIAAAVAAIAVGVAAAIIIKKKKK